MISLIVRIPLQEGKREAFIEAFKGMAANVASEEGNLLYSLNFPKKEPNLAIIMERYKDKDALAVHSESDYYKAFSDRIKDLVAGAPEVSIMDEIVAA